MLPQMTGGAVSSRKLPFSGATSRAAAVLPGRPGRRPQPGNYNLKAAWCSPQDGLGNVSPERQREKTSERQKALNAAPVAYRHAPTGRAGVNSTFWTGQPEILQPHLNLDKTGVIH